jgi:hypothetical protein
MMECWGVEREERRRGVTERETEKRVDRRIEK